MNTRLLWIGASIMVVGAAVTVGAYLALGGDDVVTTDPKNAKAVALGRTIYARECASCHGGRLEGQANWRVRLANGRMPAPPHDASGHTWHHADRVLLDITKRGPAAYPAGYVTDMPAYGERMTDREIAAVIAYIKSTWPLEIQRRQQQASH